MFKTLSNLKQTLWPHSILFIILCFVAELYYPGLYGPLILDDIPNLKSMLLIVDGEMSWIDYMRESGFGLNDRPISKLSFVVNFTLFGSDVWYLKAVNLLIHLCTGVVIYCFCYLLLSQPRTNVSINSRKWIALWVASAWLLAPMQVSTTLYVVQRMAQLPTLFVMIGLVLYVLARQQISRNPGKSYLIFALIFLVIFPLAIYSKENGLILPLLVIVIEYFFFSNKDYVTFERNNVFRSLFILFVIPVILVLSLVYAPSQLLEDYQFRDFTLYERVLTESRILCDYILNLLMIPGGSGMGLFHDDYQKSSGLFSPITTILSIVFWLSVIALAFFKAGTKAGFVLFGFVFYLTAHAIESSIIPLELYFEHRNYLPSVGIFFSIGLGVYYLIENKKIEKIAMVTMILILCSYSIFTKYRVDLWRSWESILLSSQQQHPNSLRVQRGLSVVFIHRGETEKALEHLMKVERLDDGSGETGIAMKYLMAYCYANKSPADEIYKRLDKAEVIPYDHYTGTVFMWLVESFEEGLCQSVDVNRLLEIFNKRILYTDENINYNNWVQIVLLSRLHASQHDWTQASKLINKAIELKPNDRKQYVQDLKRYYESMQK